MLKIILAFLKKLAATINNFIKKIEAKIKNMETQVKSEVSGLTKMAAVKNFTIDAEGNFTLQMGYTYKDANGNVLQYADQSKATETITGTAPDASIDPATYTVEQAQAASKVNAVVAAFGPVIQAILPDAQ
jgi:hypothetical protein